MPRRIETFGVCCAALLIATLGCERDGAVDEPSAESPDLASDIVEESTPAVIDSDWVASKLELPPPPKQKDWLKEIEKDPIRALKQMDPAALQRREDRPPTAKETTEATTVRTKARRSYEPSKPLRGWPPSVGQFYPDVVLEDQAEQVTAISDFRGKVVLVELVGLTCPACNALAGGNDPGKGRFREVQPQPGLSSIERYAQEYAKLSLDHPDVVFVQLVLYGMDGRSPPTKAGARQWARHFGMNRNRDEVVLIGDERFISPQSRSLIPGFHLIDQNGILRSITSNDPRHDDLYTALLPTLASLVEDGR